MRQNLEDKAIGLSSNVSSVINREIITVSEITANVAMQVGYYHKNNNLTQLLDQVIDKYPDLFNIQISLDSEYYQPPYFYSISQHDGNNLITQQNKATPAEKTISVPDKPAEITKSSGWSSPYLSEGNKVMATYFHPVYEIVDGENITTGLICSSISLEELNIAINEIDISDPGYAFVIDGEGNYLTHPDETKIFYTNLLHPTSQISKKENLLLKKLLKGKSTGTAVAYPEILNNKKSWIYLTPLPQTNWYMIFVMPYNVLYRDLYILSAKMTVLSLVAILIVFFLVSYIIKKQIRPLSHAASKLSSFSSPFILNTQNEVKQVSNSLEYLKVWFDQYQIAREAEEKNNLQHKRDLQQASEIQQSLIKNSFPAFPSRTDIDLHAIYKPAKIVSGDLFDYYFIDDNNLIFTIGDVSGKGIPAAIFMGVCQTIIKKNSHLRHPKKIIENTNYELCTSNNNQYFLTLFLGILNVNTGILTYCNAAHTFPILLRADRTISEVQSIHGLPLGLYPDKAYGSKQLRMHPGDTILLYTDGVYDALNEKNIPSGNEWIQNNLTAIKSGTPKEITEILDRELSEYESKQKDDICLLAIKYTPN